MASYFHQKTIPLSSLPYHPNLHQDGAANRPSLKQFVEDLGQQSAQLISSIVPDDAAESSQGWKSIGKKKEADMYASEIAGEYWACRRSLHTNSNEDKSFSWSEIYGCLFLRHFECEKDWAPTFQSFERLIDWEEAATSDFHGLSKVELGIFATRHSVGAMLKDRLFPIVLLKAQTRPDSFFVTSLALSADDYKQIKGLEKKEKVVVGRYNSVERVRLMPALSAMKRESSNTEPSGTRPPMKPRLPSTVDPTSKDRTHDERSPSPEVKRTGTLNTPTRDIEMMMALSSDAGGNIPGFAQKKALPGSVAVDVEAIRKYLINERLKFKMAGRGTFKGVEWSNGSG